MSYIDMPKTEVVTCPQCSSSVLSSISRLVRDTCGHQKCRLCLVKEEGGCKACKLKDHCESLDSINEDSNFEEPEISTEISSEIHTPINCINGSNDVTQNLENTEKCVSSLESNSVSTRTVKRKTLKIGNHLTPLPGTPLKYLCTICNKQCTSKKTIRYHNYCGSQTKPFTCETCGKGFVMKTHFEYHTLIHTGILPYVCSECGKGFKQQGKLNRHLRIHSGERPFVCQDCGKTFASIENLKGHQRAHKGKSHICPTCSRSFADYSNFKKHVYRHKGEKTFMCDECGKTFALRKNLMAHIYIHTRERNYVCNVCNRKFAMKRDLKRHEVMHSKVRALSCSLCDVGFRRKDNLARHMKNTHPATQMAPGSSRPSKPRLPNTKVILKNVKQTIVENDKKTLENNNSCEEEVIPPSQTINPELLNSVPVLTKKKIVTESPQSDCFLEQSNCSEYSERLPLSNVTGTNVSNDYPSTNVSLSNEELDSVQLQEQCFKNFKLPKTIENSSVSKQEVNTSTTSTIYPPKKNIEYYRAVPVINRPNNTSSIVYNEHSSNKVNDVDSVRREEGPNCVPTITRAENSSSSVITRNHQQSADTVVKHTPIRDNLEKLEKQSCIRETRNEQPYLRSLLHDVNCCDNDNILNLTGETNFSEKALFQEEMRQLDNCRLDRVRCRKVDFTTEKCQETCRETSTECGLHEYSNPVPRCTNLDYGRKISPDVLFTDDHFRINMNSSFNYHLTHSSYTEYQNSNPENVSHYSEVPLRNRDDLKHSDFETYSSFNSKTVDFDDKLKSTDVFNSGSIPGLQSIGLPVIVGAKKISNNVICSNFNS